jgi:DnaK suppressor protein
VRVLRGAAAGPRTIWTVVTQLTQEQLEHFRALLEQEKAAIEARIRERNERIRATVREPDELADVADGAAMLADREQAIIENDLDADTLAKVERALERIQDGTYGISEASGRPIPIERLEAVPWAPTLVDERPPDETG